MEYNMITNELELLGTTITKVKIDNNIVDIEKEAKRAIGLNINEPNFDVEENHRLSQMCIDFQIEVEQAENEKCRIELSIEGAFVSGLDIEENDFRRLVAVNGAAALIGIARGKLESISASIFNNGKIVIPFVNVLEYYKGMME